jgi:hypothetical protein
VTCGPTQACDDGNCVETCLGVVCQAPQTCEHGACVDDACATATCAKDEVCDPATGGCTADPCATVFCQSPLVCVDGTCGDDPCLTTVCPANTACVGGECVVEDESRRIFLGGGPAGCNCRVLGAGESAGGPGPLGTALLALLGLAGAAGLRRRRWRWRASREARAARAARGVAAAALALLVAAAAAALSGGCVVDPYDFEGNGGRDAGPADASTVCTRTNFGIEQCDGVDNDCDGVVDDGFDTTTDPLNCGACGVDCRRPGAETECVNSQCVFNGCATGFHDLDMDPANGCEYECLADPDPTELCDERDNDCNGDVDEAFNLADDPGNCGFCGVQCVFPNAGGLCMAGICLAGACDPDYYDVDLDPSNGCEYFCLPSAGGLEVCDLVDNDCDGVPDDGVDVLGDPLNCGACGVVCSFANATAACSAGACVLGTCDAGFLDLDNILANGCEYACPSVGPELCNGMDDDCNGLVDDAVTDDGAACGNGTGSCVPGTEVCSGGLLVCAGGVGPSVEVCDGLDNDCDGLLDDGLTGFGAPCGTNVGECSTGTTQCVTGAVTCVGAVGPAVEACDGLDEDCDGVVDNGVPGLGVACGTGTGECTPGMTACSGGAVVCAGGQGPGPERCNGLDDDCDGASDETADLIDDGGPCGTNTGECSTGTYVCSAGALTCSGGQGPVAETCNGLDDDCDGFIDDSPTDAGGACGNGTGQCQFGAEACVGGMLVCQGGTGPSPEVCDGLDNDCDGTSDETADLIDDGGPCGTAVGECTQGAETCVTGVLTCTGGQGPVAETCNGLDDDCDGAVDEVADLTDDGALCGSAVGQCAQGTMQCIGATLVCTGGVGPAAELCNGLDDDCNGVVDNAPSGVGGACGTGTGECAPGTYVCSGGTLVCTGGVGPAPETCNGLDDDCNGVVDNNLTDQGMPCGCGLGVCTCGAFDCQGGTLVCVGAGTPSPEICDGIDTNCDGTADPAGCLTSVAGGDVRVDIGAPTASNSVQPAILGDGGEVHIAWLDRRVGNANIEYRRSLDFGATFGTELAVASNGDNEVQPAIATNFGSNIYVPYLRFDTGVDRDVFWDRSTTNGTSFLGAVALDSGDAFDVTDPHVAADGAGHVYVVWVDYDGGTGTRNIKIRRSTDGGATFGVQTRINSTEAAATSFTLAPQIAIAGSGRVLVTWRDLVSGAGDIYVDRSDDFGLTWLATDVRLDTDVAGVSNSDHPSIFADGTNVWVVWEDFRTGSAGIRMNRSTNSGTTWLAADVALDGALPGGESFNPHVAGATPNAVVVWQDDVNGAFDIYATYSSDSGATWAVPDKLDTDVPVTGISFEPVLDVDGSGTVCVGWLDDRSGLSDVFMNYSLDDGATWQPMDVRLDTGSGPGAADASYLVMSMNGSGGCYFAWADNRLDPVFAHIYFNALIP